MSMRIGDVSIIEVEPDRKCELCEKVAECRPYGPNGEQICFECGELDAIGTQARMKKVLFGK